MEGSLKQSIRQFIEGKAKQADAAVSGTLDPKGHELLDEMPLALPAGFERPESIAETIQRLVRTELSRQASDQGMETFEEADDFDVDDDNEPVSVHELDAMTENLAPWREDYERAEAIKAAEERVAASQARLDALKAGMNPASPAGPSAGPSGSLNSGKP